jgi:DNA-binding LacI/PurR family transcriptional regulator
VNQNSSTVRPVTMEDVARDAGVSRALVSLVMRDSPNVSPSRRAAVLESAAALGYSPNRLASRLASHRTKTLGVLLLNLHNTVFADIYDGIAEGIAGSGNQLMVAVGSTDPKVEAEAIRSFVDLRTDGILLAGYTGSPEDLETMVRGTPAVVITREIDADGVDSVLVDDLLAGELAVDHLYGLGHRRIALVDKPDWLPYRSRRQGYLRAMERYGLEPMVLRGDMTERGGRLIMEDFLASGTPLPTAIFADNDVTAIGVMEALTSQGLNIPGDVAVVGCDNTQIADSPLVGLTSVDQHAHQLGRLAAEILLARLEGGPVLANPLKLEPTLVVRRSTAAGPL